MVNLAFLGLLGSMVGLGIEAVDWCPEATKGVNGLEPFQREIPVGSWPSEGWWSGENRRRRPKVGGTHVVNDDGLRTAVLRYNSHR